MPLGPIRELSTVNAEEHNLIEQFRKKTNYLFLSGVLDFGKDVFVEFLDTDRDQFRRLVLCNNQSTVDSKNILLSPIFILQRTQQKPPIAKLDLPDVRFT